VLVAEYAEGDRVRVVRLSDRWSAEHHWVVGQEGVIETHYPGRGWGVFIDEPPPEGETLWIFEEDEIEAR
jgi:hypothetical protein